MLLLANAQAAQQGGCIAFGGISAHLGKLVLQFSHTDAILVGKVRLAVQSFALLHHLPHGGVTHEHCVEHCLLVILEVVLAQYAQALARAQFHSTLGGLQLTADGLQQGRFSSTVGTDHSVDVAVSKLHVHVLVENALAELYGDVA